MTCLLIAQVAFTILNASMRPHDISSSLLYLITIIAHTTQPASAAVLPTEEYLQSLSNVTLLEKRCSNPCGYYGQLCCQSDQYCYTDSNDQAQCGQNSDKTTTITQGGAATTTNGQWSMYTTTYVQTDLQTVTTTYSSFYPAASSSLTCSYQKGETDCGTCCCLSGQVCAASGQCVLGSSNILQTSTVTQQSASAAIRPTSATVVTITSYGSVIPGTTATGTYTATTAFGTAVSTGGSIITGTTVTHNNGLSGGAIAGIVIGVIVGIILLILLCACLCIKSIWDGLLDILGIGSRGRRRTTETEYIEERRSRRHGGWFGGGPGRGSRTEVIEEKDRRRQSGGWGGLATVGAALGGLALLLGLKRSRDRRREEDKSSVSYDSYYSEEYTSASELS